MTRKDILINSIWTSGKMNVHSDFFEREVQINLFTSDYNLKNTAAIISEKFVLTINDFLILSKDCKPLMKELLYKHCVECCENTSYGFEVLDNETETQANFRTFGVTDEDSAFEKSNIDHIAVDESNLEKNRYVSIVFYPNWETEHGCELILKNGELLNHYGETGVYIGQFD